MSPLSKLFFLAGLAVQATAYSTVKVVVGKTGLSFVPNNITAAVGDVLEFHFWAKNHSVVQGLWSEGCQPATHGGFFSGFFPTAAGVANPKVFRVTINDTDPLVFYCAQNTGSHCKNGMVGVVNPSGSNTLEAYLPKAQAATTAVAPPTVFGGVVLAPEGDTSTATMTVSVSASAAPSGTSAATGTSGSSGTTSTSASASPTRTNGAAALGVSFAGLAVAGAAAVVFV
ncbi:extracellular serine-rich protein [Podospora appendiculata]|uniref:Extracellular serine-rich protein n=1 Tax=Podospora appendiculata TaxID=314037 RepID=A0AAE0X7F1_9PEZI|nr:extracellular serine-rich protein [Podospora appendiculata]